MKYTFLDFARAQLAGTPPVTVADLSGKTVVVTGGNTGIGYEAVKHFSTMNPAKIIIACRSEARGQEAIDKLKSETGYSKAHVRVLDLAVFASVSAFASRLLEEEDRLDIFVANAAIGTPHYRASVDGWEESTQVNCLSTILTCALVLPLMKKTAERTGSETRLVIVGSTAHHESTLEEKIINDPTPLRTFCSKEYCTESVMYHRYPDTKLVLLFMFRAFANAIKSFPVVPVLVCPGFCVSSLRHEITGIDGLVFWVMEKIMGWTSEQGSRQLIWASLAPNKDDVLRGSFVATMKPTETSDHSLSPGGLLVQEKIWKETVAELTRVDARVSQVLA